MKKFLIAGALAASVFATSAYADTIRVNVPVLDSQPNYITKNVRTPHQQCNTVDVPIYDSGSRNNTGEIIGGAIIGGIIGDQIKGKGNAAAGAVIGGLLGNAHGNSKKSQGVIGYRQEQRCSTHYTTERVEEINGYTVTYELDGKRYTTYSRNYIEPGRSLSLTMKVVSVFANN